MILRSYLSPKCSFGHNECSPDNPRERKIIRQKSRSHSLNVRKRWESIFYSYNHHQTFLLDLSNKCHERIRSISEKVEKFCSKQPLLILERFLCIFNKLSKSFPPIGLNFLSQPPRMILRSFSSSKCSFGHIEPSPDNRNNRNKTRQKIRACSLNIRKRWKKLL